MKLGNLSVIPRTGNRAEPPEFRHPADFNQMTLYNGRFRRVYHMKIEDSSLMKQVDLDSVENSSPQRMQSRIITHR